MSKQEVAVKEEAGLPAAIDFGADMGEGFEQADSSCFAIPFLRVLQAISPAVKKTNPEYIQGAEEGDMVNTVTGTLWKQANGITVVPCAFVRKFNEWAPNRGGFRGAHDAYEGERLLQECVMVEKQGMTLPNGNVLTDTREHYVIAITPDGGYEPLLLSLSSTELKTSKNWMTMMQNIRINGQVAPMFSQLYHLSTVPVKNDRGEWMGLKVKHLKTVDNIELYKMAKDFREMIRSGKAQAVEVQGEFDF